MLNGDSWPADGAVESEDNNKDEEMGEALRCALMLSSVNQEQHAHMTYGL